MLDKAIEELQKLAAKAADDANHAEASGAVDIAVILDAREVAFRDAIGALKKLQLETVK